MRLSELTVYVLVALIGPALAVRLLGWHVLFAGAVSAGALIALVPISAAFGRRLARLSGTAASPAGARPADRPRSINYDRVQVLVHERACPDRTEDLGLAPKEPSSDLPPERWELQRLRYMDHLARSDEIFWQSSVRLVRAHVFRSEGQYDAALEYAYRSRGLEWWASRKSKITFWCGMGPMEDTDVTTVGKTTFGYAILSNYLADAARERELRIARGEDVGGGETTGYHGEYAALRAEILKKMEARTQLVNFTLVTTGAVFGLGFGSDRFGLGVFLLYPVVSFTLFLEWARVGFSLLDLGEYIRDHLESRQIGLGWQTFIGRRYRQRPTAILTSFGLRNVARDVFPFLLFGLPQFFALLLGFILLLDAQRPAGASGASSGRPLSTDWLTPFANEALLIPGALVFTATIVYLVFYFREENDYRARGREASRHFDRRWVGFDFSQIRANEISQDVNPPHEDGRVVA